MELYLLDKNFQICGIIDDFSSLIWNRKYYDCGNFKLQYNQDLSSQFANAVYIYSKNFREIGILETFDYKKTAKGLQINRSGRFLESKISQRVISTTKTYKNQTTENIIRNLVDTFIINGASATINLTLGPANGLGTRRTMQVTGDNVMSKIYELCEEEEISIRINYDFTNNNLVFEVWQGLDRTSAQNINNYAVFSRNFENILEDKYSTDDIKYCNYAYVLGEVYDAEGTAIRTSEIVNMVGVNEERRELYVDARDIQKEEETTDSEYHQMLRQRGIDKLKENSKIEISNFKIDSISNLVYKQDFDLGDKVTYKNEDLGIIIDNRITEITESYENGKKTIDVTFGKDYNIKRIKEMI